MGALKLTYYEQEGLENTPFFVGRVLGKNDPERKKVLDYFPYGMPMVGRNTNLSDYRFGMNGMEMDNEAKGNGNSYTSFFRQYDPRLARWASIDPVVHPWQSPYNAFDANPIAIADPSGADGEGTGGGGSKVPEGYTPNTPTEDDAKIASGTTEIEDMGTGIEVIAEAPMPEDAPKGKGDTPRGIDGRKDPGGVPYPASDLGSYKDVGTSEKIYNLSFAIEQALKGSSDMQFGIHIESYGEGGDPHLVRRQNFDQVWFTISADDWELLSTVASTTKQGNDLFKYQKNQNGDVVIDKPDLKAIYDQVKNMKELAHKIEEFQEGNGYNNQENNSPSPYNFEKFGDSDTTFHISTKGGINIITNGAGDTIGKSLFHPKRYWLNLQK